MNLTRRDFMKVVGIGGLGAAAFALTGCGGDTAGSTGATGTTGSSGSSGSSGTASTPTPSGSDPKVLRVGVDYDFGDLSPWGVSSRGRTYYKNFVYENLVQCNLKLNAPIEEREPWIAKEWEWVEEYKSMKFKIFDNIVDAKGNKITAEDVAYSYNFVKEAGTVDTVNTYLDSCSVIDEYTVQVNLKMVALMAMEDVTSGIGIVSKKTFEESGDNMASGSITTARYQMGDIVPGSSLEFNRRDDYWQTDEEYVGYSQLGDWDKIVYVVISETSQMAISLETGTIDVTVAISSDEVDRFVVDGVAVDGYDFNIGTNGLINCLFFNMSDDSILGGNLALRKAICYAVDTDAVRQSVVGEKGRTLHDFTAPNQLYYNPAWDEKEYWDYNLEKAKQCFAESGLQEGSVNLTVMTSNNALHNRAAEIIQSYLLQIGINLEIAPYEAALFNTYKYETNQWDMMIDNKASGRALNNYYAWMFDNNTYDNGGVNFLIDPDLQAHVEEGLKPDGAIVDSVEWIRQYLIDNAVALGLWQPFTYYIGRTEKIESMYTTPINGLLVPAIRAKD